jgi:hypothetical protein
MDDANVPSLLSIPLYARNVLAENPVFEDIYQNTRRFVLSPNNPFFFVGRSCCGIGSVSFLCKSPKFRTLFRQSIEWDEADIMFVSALVYSKPWS